MNSESIIGARATRETTYKSLIPQLRALIKDETDVLANLANLAAALKSSLGFFWVGFYRVSGVELVLGPFQGPVACTRIQRGKGVCGTAWDHDESIIVEDVDSFPGHISCNAASRSEIVIPVHANDKVRYVLDIDSDLPGDFDQTDKFYLEEIVRLLEDSITESGP